MKLKAGLGKLLVESHGYVVAPGRPTADEDDILGRKVPLLKDDFSG
jgi:hypothetical protein